MRKAIVIWQMRGDLEDKKWLKIYRSCLFLVVYLDNRLLCKIEWWLVNVNLELAFEILNETQRIGKY